MQDLQKLDKDKRCIRLPGGHGKDLIFYTDQIIYPLFSTTLSGFRILISRAKKSGKIDLPPSVVMGKKKRLYESESFKKWFAQKQEEQNPEFSKVSLEKKEKRKRGFTYED